MAKTPDPVPDEAPDAAAVDKTADATKDTAQGTGPTADSIHDGMSEQDIRDAGLKIDLPYEAPPGSPEPLQYADDAGEGWTPPEGFMIAGVPYDQVVAGIGGGAMPQQQTPEVAADVKPAQTPEPG